MRVIDSPPDGTAVEVNVGDAPFLVDTVREAINAQGSTIRLLLHPVVGVRRDAGRLDRAPSRTRAARRPASR